MAEHLWRYLWATKFIKKIQWTVNVEDILHISKIKEGRKTRMKRVQIHVSIEKEKEKEKKMCSHDLLVYLDVIFSTVCSFRISRSLRTQLRHCKQVLLSMREKYVSHSRSCWRRCLQMRSKNSWWCGMPNWAILLRYNTFLICSLPLVVAFGHCKVQNNV